jgi:hypothetical protein
MKMKPAGIGILARYCRRLGLHTAFGHNGSKTHKRCFFISLDNFL